MLRRINWKFVLQVFTWILCLGGLVTLMGFISAKKETQACSDVKIIIPGTTSFIDRHEIDKIILTHSGALKGKPLHEIQIHKLEEALKENPYIKDAKVYADMNGVVHIGITQREPVLRILNYTNQDFYVDNEGIKIPSSVGYTPHVLVASGYIMESYPGKSDSLKTKLGHDLFKAAMYIESDTLWREQVEQVYVNQRNEIELVPRVGNHKIILGDADSLETRFNNLLLFYKKALPLVGWDAYKSINIKYARQIVCERNMNDSNKINAPETIGNVPVSAANIREKIKTTTP